MRHRIPVILFLFLLLSAPQAQAQYYNNGSAPTSVRWSQIKSDHFTVIFPREIDSLAREYLYSFERTRQATLTGLHIDAPRMPMVLQPYNMYSNGSVSWAPRHIELYTTPPGRPLYALDWETQLAVHEGRHVGQFAHYIRGALFPFQILAGEQGFALAFPSSTQMEGDAVQHETDMTGTGRGRDPEFLKYYRAAFLADDYRSYDHWRYGSYRYYTPNKYAFGYLISSTMRKHSGNYFAAGDLLEEKVHSWWRVFSQSHRSYIKSSGQTVRKNWREAVANYNAIWRWDYLIRAPYSDPDPVLKGRSMFYTEFNNPLPFEKGVFATMSGLPFERRLVRIDTTGKYHYVRPFASSTSTLVKDGETFVFSELVPDPRWEQRSWSVIRRYDTRNGRMQTLTRHTRYVNPSVAPDGKILAAEYRVTGGSNAVVLDAEGKLLERFPAPENGQIVNIVQLGDARYATVITHEGEGVWRHDGDWTRVLAPQKRMIRDLQASGDSLLYFITDLDGLSNVYAFDPDKGTLRCWVNAPYGADKPYLDPASGTLYYANYDHLGYLPVRLPVSKFDGKSASFDQPYAYTIADQNAEQMIAHVAPRTEEEDALLRSHLDSLETRPYSKFLHGFRFHSWAPFYANVDRIMNDLSGFDIGNLESIFQYVSLGATLLSQNDQGTLVSTLGYSYFKRHHAGHAYIKYSGLYPVFEAAFDFNERDRIHQKVVVRPDGSVDMTLDTLSKPACNLSVQMSIPLTFSKGGWNTTVTPRVGYLMTNDSFALYRPGETVQETRLTQLVTADLLVDTRVARATSRLTPRLGFGLELSGQRRIGEETARKPIYALRAYTYLPGFRAEDGFKLSYFRQYQPQDGMIYSPSYNLVRRPFGYDNLILMDYHRLLAEYALPIYAGDVNGGFFFYLKRIILIPFVDMARDLQSPQMEGGHMTGFAPRNFLSYGTRLMLNTYLFRIGTEFKIGIQYARAYDSNKWGSIRFVLSTGL